MDNRWSEEEVRDLSGVDLLVHQSRLVGADPNLVIWGRRQHFPSMLSKRTS